MFAAARSDGLPPIGAPEVAFAGRSNVGKSSLINALTGRSALARTSHTPGRTQELIFFDLNGKATLVDMPGYGYAAVSKEKSASWGQLVRDYLRGRPSLLRVFVLVDGRHGLKESDHETMKLLDASAVSYAVVLTKRDEVKAADAAGADRGDARGLAQARRGLSRGRSSPPHAPARACPSCARISRGCWPSGAERETDASPSNSSRGESTHSGAATEKWPVQSVRDRTRRATVSPGVERSGHRHPEQKNSKAGVGSIRQASSPKSLSKVRITAPLSKASVRTFSSGAPGAVSWTQSTI